MSKPGCNRVGTWCFFFSFFFFDTKAVVTFVFSCVLYFRKKPNGYATGLPTTDLAKKKQLEEAKQLAAELIFYLGP